MDIPVLSDWLSVLIAVVAIAATVWRIEYRIGQILNLAEKHFEVLSRDHETAMKDASRRHRQVLDTMSAEKDRHHDDHKQIALLLTDLVGKCERILDKVEK